MTKQHSTTYRGFKLIRDNETLNYSIVTPRGFTWGEVAANLATAKRWVDCELANKQSA